MDVDRVALIDVAAGHSTADNFASFLDPVVETNVTSSEEVELSVEADVTLNTSSGSGTGSVPASPAEPASSSTASIQSPDSRPPIITPGVRRYVQLVLVAASTTEEYRLPVPASASECLSCSVCSDPPRAFSFFFLFLVYMAISFSRALSV
jgi:hypothetical protein